LTEAKCGMQNARTKFIWAFKEQFYSNPENFYKVTDSWTNLRNKLVGEVNGIGVAKVSFVLEMCYPFEAQVSCIDIHSIKLYELPTEKFNTKNGMVLYQNVEKHWIDTSLKNNVSPYISRCLFWDRKQNKEDSSYWSNVFHSNIN
jgi:thermostable 8-oxoguanine DNA glycosylase